MRMGTSISISAAGLMNPSLISLYPANMICDPIGHPRRHEYSYSCFNSAPTPGIFIFIFISIKRPD
ncbi:hypothetical protein F5X97DRAFT_306954 [Nemania serpens]|nr:hypothetical protein F5X97DRAFT_306954 [Nemania serpens]